MPLAAASATLGVQLAAAAGSVDPPGIAGWAAIGVVIATSLPSFCSSFNPLLGTPMVSAGGGIINPGSGKLVAIPGAPLGLLLAAASLSVDAAGIAKWTNVATTLVSWMGANAVYGPAGLVGFTGGGSGSVTGNGKVQFVDENIGPSLAAAAGATDEVGIAKWTAIGAVIIAAVKTNGQIAPASLVNPGPSGPVTGAGTFT